MQKKKGHEGGQFLGHETRCRESAFGSGQPAPAGPTWEVKGQDAGWPLGFW